MNSTGRWLARIGALVIVLGFFLPAMAVSCSVDTSMGGMSDLFGVPGMPNLGGRLLTVSLNDLAGSAFVKSGALLYLVPLGALAVLILTFLTSLNRNQEQGMLMGQIAGVGIGALAVIVAVLTMYSQVQQLPLFTVNPDVGLFVLIIGYGLVAAGIVMQFNERPPVPEPVVVDSVDRYGDVRRRRRPRDDEPMRPRARTVPAWLVTGDGRQHQLLEGTTRVGRSSRNDISLTGDESVSREHAKIIEDHGHFRLVDLGGKGGTRVNGHRIRGQILLQSDDEVQFGRDTVIRFVKAGR